MELVERFQKYAEDFEKTYVDDDWSRIAPYFTEDCFPSAELGQLNALG